MTTAQSERKAVEPPLLVNVGEAARLLSLCPTTVRRMAYRGELKSSKHGTRLLFPRQGLDEYVARLMSAPE